MAKVRKDSKGRVLRKGEIYRKDNGLYSYNYIDSLGKRKCFYAKDLPELREKEKHLMKDMLDGIDASMANKVDVNYMFDRYMATKTDIREHSYATYCSSYDKYVRDGFGKRKISSVRYSDVILFYDMLSQRGLKINTIKVIHNTLNPTFKMAVRDNIIRMNPAEGAMTEIVKQNKDQTSDRHALTIEQERAFLEYVDEVPEFKRWKPLFTVMFGTGCRLGEVAGLIWDDIDTENNVIYIRRTVSHGFISKNPRKKGYRLALPKTTAGIRTVPLLDKVKEAFEMEKAYQEMSGKRNIREINGLSGFVFCNSRGSWYDSRSVNNKICDIVSAYNANENEKMEKYGKSPVFIPEFTAHVTRHTFCTRLCENETNVKVIQSVMGHSDIKTTLNIYAEVSERKKQEAFRQIVEDGIL